VIAKLTASPSLNAALQPRYALPSILNAAGTILCSNALRAVTHDPAADPQAEQRRLAWMAKQLDLAPDAEDPDPDLDLGPAPDTPGGRTAQRKLEKAARRLEVFACLVPTLVQARKCHCKEELSVMQCVAGQQPGRQACC